MDGGRGGVSTARTARVSRAQEEAAALARLVYAVTELLPARDRDSLGDQMRRAATSVVSNIAEGSARASSADRGRLFTIAWASLRELEAQVDLTAAARLTDPLTVQRLTLGCRHTGRLLHALRKSRIP